jgi:hypothetical protein
MTEPSPATGELVAMLVNAAVLARNAAERLESARVIIDRLPASITTLSEACRLVVDALPLLDDADLHARDAWRALGEYDIDEDDD